MSSSSRPRKTVGSITTTAQALHQENPYRAVLLLEGFTDVLMYEKFLSVQSYRNIVCDGKANVLESAKQLGASSPVNMLAFCDADYDRLLNVQFPATVITTDFHDSEMLALFSDAIKRVEREYVHKYSHLSHEAAAEALRLALAVAHRIGALRLANQREKWGIKFKAVNPGAFVGQGGSWDARSYFNALVASIATPPGAREQIEAVWDGASKSAEQPDHYNGHDVCALLGAYLLVPYGYDSLDGREVEKDLRLALTPDEFARTRMHADILTWERNSGKDILA